jgi:hypothetical protein
VKVNPSLHWRLSRESELMDWLTAYPEVMGHEIVGRERALAAWRKLSRMRSFCGVAVESDEPIAGHRIIGFGASVFVSTAFAERETSRPQPGLVARIISSVDACVPVVLSEAELRHLNTNGGLHLVILMSRWRRGPLSQALVADVQMHLAQSFLHLHNGYQFVRFLAEATDAVDIEHLKSTGIYRMTYFEDGIRQQPGTMWNPDRAFGVAERAAAVMMSGSIASFLFHYNEPVLGLHDAHQELLAAALLGLTDSELAHSLGLNLAAVKKRWASIFAQVDQVRPALLPARGPDSGGERRGPQKRHRLLAYLREHPEELRPSMSYPRNRKELASKYGTVPPGMGVPR